MWVGYFPRLFISVTSDYGEWDSLHFWPAPPEGGQNYLSVSSWDCKLGMSLPAWRPMKPLFLSTGWLLYIIWKLGPLITSLCRAIHQTATAYRLSAAVKSWIWDIILFKSAAFRPELRGRKKTHTHFCLFYFGLQSILCKLFMRIIVLLTCDENAYYLIKNLNKSDRFVFTGFRDCSKIDGLVNG